MVSAVVKWGSVTPLFTAGMDSDLRQRNLGLARAAFATEDEELSRKLSKEAHTLLSKEKASAASNISSTSMLSEAGHNEELALRGMGTR